jgi:gliding motility-associated-like protein
MADSFVWMSKYNIDTSFISRDSAKVYPDYSTSYPVTIYYPSGCIIDTAVNVRVSKVKADAGPDRWIHDGATTTLGGPMTTLDGRYTYHWEPLQFLSDSTVPNPYAYPPYDYTYYLTVTELNGALHCTAMDTVVVHINCGDFYLPNAFSPNSASPDVNRFGIINKGLVKLSYLRVYDRWGVLVFETTNPNLGWDGTFNDKAEPMGVYVWEADGFCQDGKRIKKKGNVTLLR